MSKLVKYVGCASIISFLVFGFYSSSINRSIIINEHISQFAHDGTIFAKGGHSSIVDVFFFHDGSLDVSIVSEWDPRKVAFRTDILNTIPKEVKEELAYCHSVTVFQNLYTENHEREDIDHVSRYSIVEEIYNCEDRNFFFSRIIAIG